jgi:exodeoxyribonuclease V alpha subunit
MADLTGQTIHRLLGYSPSRNIFTFNTENQLAVDVVLVDEVSMIDTALMSRLLEAIPPTAKLILLGDSEQLPSVDAGTVLADLVPANKSPNFSESMIKSVQSVLQTAPVIITPAPTPSLLTDRVVRLMQSHRSGPEIMAVAAVIYDFTADREAELFNLLSTDNHFCNWENSVDEKPAQWWRRLNDWADQYYGDNAYRDAIRQYQAPDKLTVQYDKELELIIRHLTDAKILTVIHKSNYGCDNINAYLTECVRHHLDPGSRGKYFAGMPIMVTQNDYTLDLFNGDTGVILHDAAGGYRAAFPRGEDVLMMPIDILPQHTLAFAITVHKAQGSEYNNVMLALPNTNSTQINRLLTREIIYTAITRAKQSITIHTTREALKQACLAKVERDSGMMLWEKGMKGENFFEP